MNKKMIIDLTKAIGGTVLAAAGTVLGFKGIRGLCFEKHEVGDLVQEAVEEAEEEVL